MRFRILTKSLLRLITVYVLVYVTLSALGEYRLSGFSLGSRTNSYSWAPLGFYDTRHPLPYSPATKQNPRCKTGGWSILMFYLFYPLWGMDVLYIHKNKQVIKSEATRPASSSHFSYH